MSRLLSVTLVLSTWTIEIANCVVLSEPTQRSSIGYHEQPPAPTQLIEALEFHVRIRKLEDHIFTVTVAPDSTCGFVSGHPGIAITCENGQKCVWEHEYVKGIMCGVDPEAEVHFPCVEREVALNPELCNNVCQSDRFRLRCTDTASPYCRTYAYPGGVHDFRCETTTELRPQSVSVTHAEQEDRNLLTTLISKGSFVTSRDSITVLLTSSAATAPPPNNEDNESPNIGTIVGRIIGCFTVLSLLDLGIWLVQRSKRRHSPSAQQAPVHVLPMQQAPLLAPQDNPTIVPPGVTSPVRSELPDSTMTVPTATSSTLQPNWVNHSPERENTDYYEMSGDNGPRT
ncbi:hypothetical protein B0T10DRAFT_416845 [Thelonectria olida]|uniref:Uncharacterized protein n=1 Tax=Thelonectria olida TaxID=1576542 RepID=A0A9P9AJ12_9HYPO|nr:hypothetical protein B0T10DRAFT_416845 [Thelonectria olida]